MRRKDREVTDPAEIRRILAAAPVCHLALCDGDRPYGVTMNYGFSEEAGRIVIYLHSAGSGRKLDLLRRNPQAYFFAESEPAYQETRDAAGHASMTMLYGSVAGGGSVTILTDSAERLQALAILTARYSATPPEQCSPALLARTCVWRLELDAVTAKRNG